MTTIRNEQPGDADAIRAVLVSAFPTDVEALLVERMREHGNTRISLVAETAGQIVGHIAFSPVTVNGQAVAGALGLAPIAVVPQYQRRGIGGELIRAGLAACREFGCGFVVLLGHPDYYPRFGFRRASQLGLTNKYGADEAFMVLELMPGSIPPGGGLVQYGPDFAGLD